jgi:hypothetical protein
MKEPSRPMSTMTSSSSGGRLAALQSGWAELAAIELDLGCGSPGADALVQVFDVAQAVLEVLGAAAVVPRRSPLWNPAIATS